MRKNKKNILITGCAGFIGFHLSLALLKNKNFKVYGIDNLNNYYDQKLKKDRLKILKKNKGFNFYKIDIEDEKRIFSNFKNKKYHYVVHLAAQAGVRHSITTPKPYLQTNILGFFNVINAARIFKVDHFLYASTSSVYGDSKNFPLRENFDTSKPNSFYAATKKSNEIIAYSYSHIYNLKTTGLRFFTVYGPYGRPDMALFKFTKGITENKKIELFNNGRHIRDFTYIDDVVDSIIKLIKPKIKNSNNFEILNIGSGNPQRLMVFLKAIEKSLNKKSKKVFKKFQMGDVYKTHASVAKLDKTINYRPKFTIMRGIDEFVDWYKRYFKK